MKNQQGKDYYFVELDQRRMSNHLEDMYLPLDSLYVCNVNNFIFLEDLNSNGLACEIVTSFTDFSKCAYS